VRRLDLVPDCGKCVAICCVATAFDRSELFAFDKPAGVACRHLTAAHRCRVHETLGTRGLLGCAIYDCYGAGQRLTEAFAREPEPVRDEAFLIVRVIHELLFLLTEAEQICPDPALRAEVGREVTRLDAIPCDPSILEIDLGTVEARSRALLRRVGVAIGGRKKLKVVE
jgi:hypothetical protein